MGYSERDRKRIALKVCLNCGEGDAGNHRRCRRCRSDAAARRQRISPPTPAARLRVRLAKRTIAYITLKRRVTT